MLLLKLTVILSILNTIYADEPTTVIDPIIEAMNKKKLAQELLTILLSLPLCALAANFRAAMDPTAIAKNECTQHTLCASCLEESDCVWCADGNGSCVPGSIDDGPKEDGTCKDWESSYCLHEPCASYSQCSTCTSDAFCGWSGSEEVCVEGDSEGPLTGKDRDGKCGPLRCIVLPTSINGMVSVSFTISLGDKLSNHQ